MLSTGHARRLKPSLNQEDSIEVGMRLARQRANLASAEGSRSSRMGGNYIATSNVYSAILGIQMKQDGDALS